MDTFKLIKFLKTDESILSEDTDLSICLSADGFFFSLIDKRYRLKAIGEFKVDLNSGITAVMSNLRKCFAEVDIRLFNFNKIRIITPTNKNIFIPHKLYDNTKSKEYLRSVSLITGTDTIIESISDRLDTVSVFATPMYQNSGIKILMPKAEFLSQHQIMAEYGFEISKLTNNTVVLHRREEVCDIVIYKGSQFVLSNSFNFTNENDMIYHIIFTLDQLQIDTAEVTFLITGSSYTLEEKQMLSKFIKNVSYANPMETIKVGIEFDGLDIQKYFLVLCK
jgi:hypothetical protein